MDIVDAATLSYGEFCERYMGPNRPVLLRNVGGRWFSQAQRWTRPSELGGLELNFEFLAAQYGDAQVPVSASCFLQRGNLGE